MPYATLYRQPLVALAGHMPVAQEARPQVICAWLVRSLRLRHAPRVTTGHSILGVHEAILIGCVPKIISRSPPSLKMAPVLA